MSAEAEPSSVDQLGAGWHALAQGAWDEAHTCFEQAVAQDPSAEALEGLGFAAWWRNDFATTFRAREDAYRRYHARGDRRGAARVATFMSMDHCIQRGELAIANGWLQRAYHLLDGLEPGPEQVMAAAWDAHMAIQIEHAPAKARCLCAQATTLAQAVGNFDLTMLVQACEGYVRVCEGDVDAGMRLLDEATAAAVGGEMTDPDSMTLTCCYLISACERVRDLDRAAQWCAKLREIAVRWSYQAMFAYCRSHYAGVLIWRGAWDEAEAELEAATADLTGTLPAMAVEAIARLAELRRRQGRFDEAAALLARLDEPPLRMLGSAPLLLGRAELALDRGEPLAARDHAARYLRAIHAEDRLERVTGFEILIRAQVALGEHDQATATLRELVAIATAVPTPPLRAAMRHSAGTLAIAKGDYEEARRQFEDAVDLFARSGAPYETARSRLELAHVYAALGRTDAAKAEASAAGTELRTLGAMRDAERAAALVDQLQAKRGVPNAWPTHTLTTRELDILRLVARGLGDKEMAAELGLSRHTVHRHVSNILTKLALPSRAAAVAYASEHGLL